MFISITRLRLRRWWSVPAFLWWSKLSMKQAGKSQGFISGATLADRRRAYWTLTAWESEAAMKAYRGSGAHKAVMPKLARWCDEASVVHYEADELPSWEEAWQKIQKGRFTPVEKPSEAHQHKRIDPPRTKPLIEARIG